MSTPLQDAAYQRSLFELRRLEPQDRLLSEFWTYPAGWPKGNSAMMFIGDAISKIGRTKFQDDWTGSEFGARKSISSFPTFEGTLRYHVAHRNKPEDMARPGPLSASQETLNPIESNDEKLRSQYATVAAEWNSMRLENECLRQRIEWVVQWLAAMCGDGQVDTYLRKVVTANQISEYSKSSSSFWNTENIFRDRLRNGYVELEPTKETSSHDDLERYYVFLSRKSLDHACRDLREPSLNDEGPDAHYSIFMKLMRNAIIHYGITPDNQPKKSELAAFFKSRWPGANELSSNMANAMASLVREPERQFGKAWKPTRDN